LWENFGVVRHEKNLFNNRLLRNAREEDAQRNLFDYGGDKIVSSFEAKIQMFLISF